MTSLATRSPLTGAVDQLTSAAATAAQTLEDLMQSDSESIRLRAATTIILLAARLHGIDEVPVGPYVRSR